MSTCDVAVVGAGPYGLSATAHLRAIRGLEVRTFGEPMSFWDQNMPRGMLLRSAWSATHIADPDDRWSLEAFRDQTGSTFSKPVPLERFVQYGGWYQQQAAPDLDRRRVDFVDRDSAGFRLRLSDGEMIQARRVVIAAGIAAFASRPSEFQNLPGALVSHTSEHRDFDAFAGKRVVVIGGGQSALESGALLHESGADVEIITRSRRVHWLQGKLSKTLHTGLGQLTSRLLYAPTDVGPAGVSQLMARPDLLRRLPRNLQNRLRMRCVRPAGARWLVDRLVNVPIRFGLSTVSAATVNEFVKLRLSDETERIIDHVFVATGYKVDIARYGIFPASLLGSIESYNGYPQLRRGLETSVPGLHILGAPAAWSFGPLMQFVSGARYACRSLARSVAHNIHA